MDNLEVGVYIYTCEVNDSYTNSINDSVLIFVEYDNIKPNISGPADFNYEFGTSGHKIIWNVSDLNPKLYNISKDGILIIEAPWNGSDIILNITGLNLGTHSFVCCVMDKNNNTACDIVNITVEDTTPPVINHPSNIEYECGSTGNTLTWIATDLLPNKYYITLDGVLYKNGSWNTGENITIEIDGLSFGMHFFTCYINDTSGNIAMDTVNVYVNDTTPPTINIPQSIIIEKGTRANITWIANDLNPSNFYIYCNGSLIRSGVWNNTPIVLDLYTFPEGIYNITCKVIDIGGNSITSSVIVQITPQLQTSKPSYDWLLLIFIICIGAVVSFSAYFLNK